MKEQQIEITTITPTHEVIKWSDAHTIQCDLCIDEVENIGLPKAITVGIVIHENEERVAICQTHFLNQEKPFRHVLFIPKVMIVERFKLKRINKNANIKTKH